MSNFQGSNLKETIAGICSFCAAYEQQNEAINTSDSRVREVTGHLNGFRKWAESLCDKFQYGSFSIKITHGAGRYPRVPWLCFLPQGQETNDGVYVSVCFGREGNGCVAGFAQSVANPRGLNTVARSEQTSLNINVDGGSQRTRYNDSFENPKEFYAEAFDEQVFTEHLLNSLKRCLDYLDEPKAHYQPMGPIADEFSSLIQLYFDEQVVFQGSARGEVFAVESIDVSGCSVSHLLTDETAHVEWSLYEDLVNGEQYADSSQSTQKLSGRAIVRNTLLQGSKLMLDAGHDTFSYVSDQKRVCDVFCSLLKSLNTDGEKLYKPAMMAAVIELIDEGVVTENKIAYDDVESHFVSVMKRAGETVSKPKASMPFVHLRGDLFWMLCYRDVTNRISSGHEGPSGVRNKVSHARMKEPYWTMLQENKFRKQCMEVLSEILNVRGNKVQLSIESFKQELSESGLVESKGFSLAMSSALHAKPFLILTGLSGSGKTQMALSFAKWITPKSGSKDIFCQGASIPSANVTYFVGKSDFLSVEFWNSEDPDTAIKVSLPRDMITEWADYITENDIPYSTQARDIREVVKAGSKFSDQLHSFETHLKAAAIALIENKDNGTLRNYAVVSVGADWTSNENLLGYPDALKEKSYRKPDNGALDLILRAKKDPEHPYFLILDEMNLSHVERYFSDFLSAMESGEAINLHDGDADDLWDDVPGKLRIPKNLFVVGTVNVDETTYMFSPKVLDRANVIEFRVSDNEMKSFLSNPVKPRLKDLAGKGVQYAKAFVSASKKKDFKLEEQGQVSDVLMQFFGPLQKAGAEYGYRTAHEISRFVYFHKELSGEGWELNFAMDAAIMQKLLPKLHGAKKKLGPVLAALIRLCLKEDVRSENDPIKDEVLTAGNALYPNSLEKLVRMQKRLSEHGFTSFAEA